MLFYKGTFETFMSGLDVMECLSTQSIPVVFLFSLSFYQKYLHVLIYNDVPIYGCGFAHDYIEGSVGKKPVTMTKGCRPKALLSSCIHSTRLSLL
jgi:hypothetical protein